MNPLRHVPSSANALHAVNCISRHATARAAACVDGYLRGTGGLPLRECSSSCERADTEALTDRLALISQRLMRRSERWNAHRVELMTDARNVRSQRAIERLGAALRGDAT
jgi:hypothetical protein